MLVYRYLNEQYALEALQYGCLKVGRLLELNDPADCQPILKGAPSTGNEEEDAAFAAKYLSQLYRDIGVLCFSSVIDDPVIWTHYADSHRGIALGYKFEASGVKLFPVKYQLERAVIDYNEAETLKQSSLGSGYMSFIEKVISHGFTHKAESWSYEKEYRMFGLLEECKMKGSHYFNARMGLVPDRVVLGVRCRLTEQDIVRAVRGHSGLTMYLDRVVRAKLDPLNHKINIG